MCDFSIALVSFFLSDPLALPRPCKGCSTNNFVINLLSQSSQTTMHELNCKILKLKSHYGTQDYDNKNPEGFLYKMTDSKGRTDLHGIYMIFSMLFVFCTCRTHNLG